MDASGWLGWSQPGWGASGASPSRSGTHDSQQSAVDTRWKVPAASGAHGPHSSLLPLPLIRQKVGQRLPGPRVSAAVPPMLGQGSEHVQPRCGRPGPSLPPACVQSPHLDMCHGVRAQTEVPGDVSRLRGPRRHYTVGTGPWSLRKSWPRRPICGQGNSQPPVQEAHGRSEAIQDGGSMLRSSRQA